VLDAHWLIIIIIKVNITSCNSLIPNKVTIIALASQIRTVFFYLWKIYIHLY
jgi:hypothetical protein